MAKGSGREYRDILALNVRTEIAFGAFSDGCTAVSWRGGVDGEMSLVGQNWDWDTECVTYFYSVSRGEKVELMRRIDKWRIWFV